MLDVKEKPYLQLSESVYRSFDTIDAMSPDVRACVHEIGWEAVSVMLTYKLPPNAMRAICHACWSAPRSAHQRQGFGVPNEVRGSPVQQHLDTLLNRSGAQISAVMLLTTLKRHGMVVVPLNPSTPMIKASMETVSAHDMKVTKEEKHRLRLSSAIMAGAKRLWPRLFNDDQEKQETP